MIRTPLGIMHLIKESNTQYYCYDDQTGKNYWFDKNECQRHSKRQSEKTLDLSVAPATPVSDVLILPKPRKRTLVEVFEYKR